MASTKSSQKLINQFWERIVSQGTDPSVTTTLPQSIFAQGFRDQVSKEPGVAENVMADYDRAVEKCKAKVDHISRECRRLNQKYKDPSFNLSYQSYCIRPLSTYVPPAKSVLREDPVDTPQEPRRMALLVDDNPPVDLTQLIARHEKDSNRPIENRHIEESPGAQPQSVKRVRQIFDKPEFFVDGATADDVRQGNSADCWFLSALSALCSMEAAELGNLAERICVKRDEAVGVYGFVFYRDGEWRSEVVDDTLYLTAPDYKNMGNSGPEMDYLLKYIKERDRAEQYRKIVQSNSDALFFAKSAHKNETWVPLIEKAYAKAHGDFQAIEGGFVGEGIEDLTGGLATLFLSDDIVDLDQFWDEGLAKVNKSFLWGCSTSNVNEQDRRGILGRHAYSILEAQTIPDGTRLLKVRNPLREIEWEGDWGDKSKKWTDELKKLLKHEDEEDGIFWISYEDLRRNYPYLHRTRMFDASWTVAQLWTNFTVPLLSSDIFEKTFKVTLSKSATTAIVLCQLDERYFRGLKGQYDFGLSFRLHKVDEDDYLYRCHHRYFCDRSINLEVDLEAGVYEVRVKITSDRYPERPKIEDVIRINWNDSREKLLQVCRSYDLAHARVAAPEPQAKDMKAEQPTNKSNPEVEAVQPKLQGKPAEEAVSEAGGKGSEGKSAQPDPGSDADTKPANPVEGAKSDVQDTEPEGKSEEESAKAESEPGSGDDKKSKVSESKQSWEDGRSVSSVLSVHQDHRSDTDTSSTEPEMIEKANLKPCCESGSKGPKAKAQVGVKDLKSEEATAQSLHNRSVESELPRSTTSSTAQPGDSAPLVLRPPTADTQAEAAKAPEAADRKRETAIPKPEKTEDDMENEEDQEKGDDDDGKYNPNIVTDSEPASTREAKQDDGEDDGEDLTDEPFNSVCTIGLRVYCRGAEARIELIRPSTALVQNKQFTSSMQVKLDVDDPAKS